MLIHLAVELATSKSIIYKLLKITPDSLLSAASHDDLKCF